jgi:phosphatidylglycerol:prolipoprotein diacylglycerol transferase
MYPQLAEVFDQPIPAYFTMLVIGFSLATWLGARWAKRSRLDHDVVIDLGLFALIAGVVGARILHVFADGYFWDYVHLCTDPSLVDWHVTREQCVQIEGVWDAAGRVCKPAEADCFAWAAFWRGGLTYYGGLIAAGGFGLWFLSREGFPMLKAADMAGMTIPIGLFWGRMGCFLGGCCFGKPAEGAPFAVRFPAWSPASEAQWREGLLPAPHLESLPVHPAQLYEAIGCLAIALVAMLLVHPRKRFDGMVFLVFLALYAVLRFGLEWLRADDRGGIGLLSTSQIVGLVIVAGCAWAWTWLRKRARVALASAALVLVLLSGVARPALAQETQATGEVAAAGDGEEEGPPLGPVLLVGIGGVVLAVGIALFATGQADRATVEEAAPGTRWSEVSAAFDTAPTLLTVGQVVMGGAVALMAGGVAWLVLKLMGADRNPPIRALLRPGALGFRGTF